MTVVRVLLLLGWLLMFTVTATWLLAGKLLFDGDPDLNTLLGVPGPPPLEAVPDTEPDPDATPDADPPDAPTG